MLIDERKYTLLMIAGQDRQENETITQAYDRWLAKISTQSSKEAAVTLLKATDFKQVRKKRKYVRKSKKLAAGSAKFLAAIIEFDRTGQFWNMHTLSKRLKMTSAGASYHSRILQERKYIHNKKYGRRGVQKWTVLRNADGSAYVRKPTNVTPLRKAA